MKTILTSLTILAALAAFGGGAFAASDANNDVRALNARWAEQAFSAFPTEVLRNQLTVIRNDDPTNAPVKLNQSATSQPLRLADKTHARGFGLNANVVLRIALEKPAQRLLADIGVDRNADGQVASVRFRVSAGGKEVFVSDVLRPGSRQSIDLPLDGAKTLDLTVDDGGDGRTWDQANWCEPRVVLADGTTLALDELAEQGGPVVGIPFSFVYGGKTSAELLPQWRAAQKEEAVDALPLAETRTKLYFNHAGAYFPETMHFWGAHLNNGGLGYGWDRANRPVWQTENQYIRHYWQGGLELVALALNLADSDNPVSAQV